MKKLLALVLALVMSMSLVTISNAAFKDADSIDYQEAVDILNAVGVLIGDENGNFNAKAELTRGQAAKIIAYLDLGGKTADAIKGSGVVFTDVPASHWAAGYIEYCAGAGYVAGVGAGKFDPEAKVTGVQFAKMLLCALGYKAEIEGYNGTDYTIAVARDANKNDLFDGLSIVTSANLTREQAAQMAFNALEANVVEYQGGTNVTTSDGTTVVVNAERNEVSYAKSKDYAGRDGNGSNDTDEKQQLCEKLYGTDLKKVTDVDNFGAPSSNWEYDKDSVGKYADDAEFTFTTSISKSKMKDQLKGYDLSKIKAYYIDGDEQPSASFADTDAIKAITGDGVLVKLYADKKEITTVVVINENLFQINKVDTKNDKVTLKAVVGKVNKVVDVEDDDAYYNVLSAMKADDYVIITAAKTAAGYEVQTAVAAKKVTGKVTQANSDSATLAGTSYTLNDSVSVAPAVDKDKDVDFYLDTYGNVIYTTAASNTDTIDTVYVVTIGTKQDTYGDKVDVMQAVTATGEVINVEYRAASESTTVKANEAYSYEMDGDTYVLTAASTSLETSKASVAAVPKPTEVDKKDKKLGSNYFASDVNFVYIDGTKSDLKVSVKSGVQDVTLATTDYVVTAKDKDDNIVVATVYVKGDVSTSSDTVVYVAKDSADAKGTKLGDDGKTILNGFQVYVNGVKQTIYIKGSTAPTKGFYTYTVNETTGAWTLKSTTSGVATGDTVTASLVNGVYYLNGIDAVKDYDATNATVVDTVNDPTEIDTMADIKDQTSVKAAVVFDKDAETVTTIYIIK